VVLLSGVKLKSQGAFFLVRSSQYPRFNSTVMSQWGFGFIPLFHIYRVLIPKVMF